MKRIILEMGMGNDLYGEDYTKAACRAVEDAIRHSSLVYFVRSVLTTLICELKSQSEYNSQTRLIPRRSRKNCLGAKLK